MFFRLPLRDSRSGSPNRVRANRRKVTPTAGRPHGDRRRASERDTAARTPCKKSRRGAAIVEMAVVTPLFVALAMGIVEFGSLFFVRNTMVQAAREGARELAIQGVTEAEAITATQDYLTGVGITTATVTGQNAYKGNGDSAAARQVFIQVELPAKDAFLAGDALNLFSAEDKLTVNIKMRKEGELLTAP